MAAGLPTAVVPTAAAASWALVPHGTELADPTLNTTALALPGANAALLAATAALAGNPLAPSSTSLWAKQLSAAQQVGDFRVYLSADVVLERIHGDSCVLCSQGQPINQIPEIQAVMTQNPALAKMMIPNAQFKGEQKSATVRSKSSLVWFSHSARSRTMSKLKPKLGKRNPGFNTALRFCFHVRHAPCSCNTTSWRADLYQQS
jgi:hypothetical protein